MAKTTKSSWRSRLSTYFEAHGRFCASHPWEVIVTTVTLTVSALSMSVLNGGKVGTVCGISKPCVERPEDVQKVDTVLLSVVNCLAVVYIYNQFSRLRKSGSKYILGIAGLFTIFSSFVFGSTVVNLIDDKVSGLHEALPFFLLLIDLSKASSLAKFAFKSRTKNEVRENIGRGIAELGPTMSLDTLVEVLLISIGTISGVPQFETLCCFGSVSLIANYLVFMTFFPAALALFLEVCPFDAENPMWHLDELNRDMQQPERKLNPVAQRVKVIMALGLAVVHVHSRFFSSMTGLSFGFTTSEEDGHGLEEQQQEVMPDDIIEKVPLNDYLWWKAFNMSVDQIITLLLATVLFFKYIFLDKSGSFSSSSSVPPTPTSSRKVSTATVFSSSKPIHSSVTQSGSCPFIPPSSRNLDFSPGSLNRRAADESMEKLVNNGIVITDPSRRRTGNSTPSIENMSVLKPAPNTSDLTLQPVTRVSVGTQTDFKDSELPKKKSMFSFGEDSEPSTPTECSSGRESPEVELPAEPRPLNECLTLYKSNEGASLLSDEEIQLLVKAKHIPAYKLESALSNHQRGVAVRRQILEKQLNDKITLQNLPYKHYDFSLVTGACCENVIGYMPLPVGYAGPLLLDDKSYHVPMSTTEGALVASTNRGCRALTSSGGVQSMILDDGMTRGPVVRCPSAVEAGAIKVWLEERENFDLVAEVFNSTSRFARLKAVQVAVAGRLLYIRFKAFTGDAMGMNMLSKGVEKSLAFLAEKFPSLEVISLSGNYCTDKKPAAINWIEGRGKSVVCEATIPAHIVKQVLKTNVDALVDLNISKNLVGSAMAGAMGGFNAHAANVVTAIYIATGQDPAQNIASSNCITLLERSGPKGDDLYISCTMPSIEIGTVGGGTILGPQSACLSLVGVKGPNKENPGENAKQLARIVCATVLAGELSLLSALAAGHLVKSHLTHNRSNLNLASIPESPEPKEHRRTRSDTTPSLTHPPVGPIRKTSAQLETRY